MNAQFLSIASTVLGVFLVMAVGAVARRVALFTNDVDRSLAAFVTNILMPSLFFHRIMTDTTLSMNIDAWVPALYGFACTAGGFLFAVLIARSLGKWFGLKTNGQQRTFSLCAGVDNYGYIPLPLAEAFYPMCVVTLMIHNVGVDIALWSVGLFIISGKGFKDSWKRLLFSPPLLAVALAIAIRQCGLELWIPKPVLQMCEQLGRCSVPMALVLSGAIIYDFAAKFRWAQAWRPLLLASVVRMILLPFAILALAYYATSNRELREVLLLQASMPAATFPIVMTRLYNQDVETAWIVVVGTSVISLVTIPIWMVFGAQLLQLN